MTLQNAALVFAGLIGIGVAVVHGVLVQRLMVKRVEEAFSSGKPVPRPIATLIPLLLHFSTFNWLVGGFALVAAAVWLEPPARLAVALLVGSSYAYGALANCWATRGRHPGWVLYAVAVILIVIGVV